jgi:hypothetical protein
MEFKEQGSAAIMAELIDLRAKITERANQVLDAHALAKNLDKSEIVRSILDEWAVHQIHVSTVVLRVTRGQGSSAA